MGEGGSPISPVYGWVLSPASEARAELRIFNFKSLVCNVSPFFHHGSGAAGRASILFL